jgi:hypothetical protein
MPEQKTFWSRLTAWWHHRPSVRRWWLSRLRKSAVALMKDLGIDEQEKEQAAMRLLRWLLRLMSLMFLYRLTFRRENLGKDFAASIVFKTRGTTPGCSVVFRKPAWYRWNRVVVQNGCVENPNVVLTFRNGVNLFDYILFTEDHDPVNLLLENQVKMEGNLNVVYKFMYMVRYLIRPLGLT